MGIGRGGGDGSASHGSLTVDESTVLFANSIGPTLMEGDNLHDSIVFIGNHGTLYGDVVLGQDLTFDLTHILTISAGRSLAIPGTVTLLNNGTIFNSGTVTGIVTGNQPVVVP